MRVALVAVAGVVAWILWRRRRVGAQVVIAWDDGSELVLPSGPEREWIVATAGRALG